MEQGPSRQRSPQEIAAALADLQGRVPGFNSKPFADLAAYAKPNLQLMNDQLVDPATARIVRSIPKVGENQQLTFDATGNPIGVIDLQGRFRSLADQAEATALGGERGKLRDVPVGGGATRLMTGRDFMDGRGGANSELGYTPPAAQLSADKIVAEAGAGRLNDLRAAVAADAKITPILDQMEGLLKGGNLITGFGADVQLQGQRALAAMGNKEAARRVADTQTYQNVTSRQVLPLVKQLGSGAGITDADRKFTQAIVAGDIALDEETIRRVIEIGREQIRANAAALQQAQSGGGGYQGGATGPRTTMGRSRILSVE
jgi:hypothetical protein